MKRGLKRQRVKKLITSKKKNYIFFSGFIRQSIKKIIFLFFWKWGERGWGEIQEFVSLQKVQSV